MIALHLYYRGHVSKQCNTNIHRASCYQH